MFLRVICARTMYSNIRYGFINVNHNNLNSRPFHMSVKHFQQNKHYSESVRQKIRTTLNYVSAVILATIGLSYAAVPLYRIFCQTSGYGGTVKEDVGGAKIEKMVKAKDKKLKIRFNSDTAASLAWKFRPQQTEITLIPGETALAFYTATNPTDRTITGVSTYNVLPFEAGPYFNKIQCFCFEEQQLNPHEEVDMPVFFYIDPEIVEDPKMELVDEITLSYTFFEAREGMKLPIPSYVKRHSSKE